MDMSRLTIEDVNIMLKWLKGQNDAGIFPSFQGASECLRTKFDSGCYDLRFNYAVKAMGLVTDINTSTSLQPKSMLRADVTDISADQLDELKQHMSHYNAASYRRSRSPLGVRQLQAGMRTMRIDIKEATDLVQAGLDTLRSEQGDSKQLPPYIAGEVQKIQAGLESILEQTAELMARSADTITFIDGLVGDDRVKKP